jgi:hypothetical protein
VRFVLVAVAALAVVSVARGAVSPDRRWDVAFSRKNGYGRLDLTDRSTGRMYRMYRSNDACCEEITWVRPHTLVFVDDYRVMRLDPTTRRVVRIAGFSNFTVAPNGRWIAGWADSGGHSAETVHVVPLAGGSCLVVPHRADQDDSDPRFSTDSRTVLVQRRRFDTRQGEPVGRARTVAYRLSSLRGVHTC